LTGYLPAKKKGGRCTCGTLISPCNADSLANDISSDKGEDKDYSYTPAYKIIWITWPKKQDAKVTLNSNSFAFLCPTTFDMKRLIHGHPPVYLEEEKLQFDTNFQKQLLFNFSAMRATCKKSVLMQEACASCLREVDLDVTPTLFSCDLTDCHELSRYI
jgi:hypothetical protein